MINSNFGQLYKPATAKQIKYIKDLMETKNIRLEIDFMHLRMKEAGSIINQLKKEGINKCIY